MLKIATWMYSAPKGEHLRHAQTGSRSDSDKFQTIYWRCVFCFFESVARVQPNAELMLFVNREPPSNIDGVQTKDMIRKYGIDVRILSKTTRPPLDYYGAWNTQFIVLDIIDELADEANDDDTILILDSDCILNRPLDEAFTDAVVQNGALLYTIDYDIDHNINGLSRRDLARLAHEYDSAVEIKEFHYSGGEFICIAGRVVNRLRAEARSVYDQSMDRHKRGLDKFNEEAHLLSYVYHRLGIQTHTANKYIRRIWTDRAFYHDATDSDTDLHIWHLPGEKRYAFRKAFRIIAKNGFRFPDGVDAARLYRMKPSTRTVFDATIRRLAGSVYHSIKRI